MSVRIAGCVVLLLAPLVFAQDVRVLVTNERSGDVSVIDAASRKVIQTIPVGTRPRGIAVSADGTRAFVAISATAIGGPPSTSAPTAATRPTTRKSAAGNDGVAVIDLTQMKLIQTLISGRDPESLALSPDASRVYVSNEDTSEASIIDIASNQRSKIFTVGDEPEGVAVSPDGKQLYVTCETTNDVYSIDTVEQKITTHFPTAGRPRAAVFTADGSKAYITCETGGAICVVDPAANRVTKTIKPTGENVRPMGICITPDSKYVYVTTGRGGGVVRIDTASDQIDRALDHVGPRPWGVAVTPDSRWLFTANGPSNDVTMIDTTNFKIAARIPAGTSPWGVAIVTK